MTEIDKKIGSIMAWHRRIMLWTQEETAIKMNTTRQMISHWELGTARVYLKDATAFMLLLPKKNQKQFQEEIKAVIVPFASSRQ